MARASCTIIVHVGDAQDAREAAAILKRETAVPIIEPSAVLLAAAIDARFRRFAFSDHA